MGLYDQFQECSINLHYLAKELHSKDEVFSKQLRFWADVLNEESKKCLTSEKYSKSVPRSMELL